MTQNNFKSQSPHTIVRASAGSGKTYRLTNEFMIRLIDGHEPGSILATTFTRVAAGEILHRVLDRLSAAVINDQGLNDLAKALKKPTLTNDQCSKVLSNLVNHLHRLSIMTIDSFFSRMANSFSFELGLPMQYSLLEEDEDQILREQSVDQTINQCTNTEMVELLRSMQGDQVKLQTHSAIMQAVKSGYNMYLATNGNQGPWNSIEPVGRPMTTPELKHAAKQLATASIPTTKAGAPSKRWITPHQKCIQCIESNAWDSLLSGGLGNAILKTIDTNQAPTYSKTEFPSDLQSILTPVVEHARHALSTQHNARTLAIFKLMARFDNIYRETKMSTGQLSFDDPPRLLNESRITGQLQHLYYRLDTHLSHIMLDEFQDTSMPQFMLIKPILDELLSQDTEDRSVFVVGDIKQSLYTWRQAEPKLLGAMKDHWETLNDESMADSWRSSPIVLNTVNDIFGDLPNNTAMKYKEVGIQAATNWNEQYDTHNAADPNKTMPGYASLTVADEPEDTETNSEEIAEAMYWACATHVQEAKAQSPNATIAILVRQTKHIYPLLAKLNALNIEACENRGNPLVDAPSVAAAVSMLHLIDHPSDTAALHHVQSTPLAKALGLEHPNDIHPIAAALRHRTATQGCVPLLIEWLNTCADAMDQRGNTRFKQLIDLAGHLQDQGHSSPSALASIAQNRKIDDPAQAPVRVLTIHGSKGLEFDAVILPLFEAKWEVKHENILAMRDEPLGPIAKVTRYPDQTMQQVHPTLKALHDDSMLKQINEELCCLYVATTRAKSSLQMILPADKEGRDPDQPKPLPDDKYRFNPAHVIRAALAPDEPATPGSTLWESSIGTWTDNIKSKTAPPTSTTPVTLNLIAPSTLKAGQLTTAAPSMLHQFHQETTQNQNASDLLNDSQLGQSARDFGQCVHNAFEQFDWADQSIPTDEQITQNLASQGHSSSHISQSLKILQSSLQNKEIADLLNHSNWKANHPEATSTTVHHERPFAQRLGDPERLVQGRFDRLIIGRDNNRITNIHIIDYKTDHAASKLDAQALAEHAQKHQPQMNAYRQAIKAMYNLDDSAIQVTLIFTSAPAAVHL